MGIELLEKYKHFNLYKSIKVGLLSVIAIFVQLFGYGIGFITEGWKKIFEEKGFKQTGERIEYPS